MAQISISTVIPDAFVHELDVGCFAPRHVGACECLAREVCEMAVDHMCPMSTMAGMR